MNYVIHTVLEETYYSIRCKYRFFVTVEPFHKITVHSGLYKTLSIALNMNLQPTLLYLGSPKFYRNWDKYRFSWLFLGFYREFTNYLFNSQISEVNYNSQNNEAFLAERSLDEVMIGMTWHNEYSKNLKKIFILQRNTPW